MEVGLYLVGSHAVLFAQRRQTLLAEIFEHRQVVARQISAVEIASNIFTRLRLATNIFKISSTTLFLSLLVEQFSFFNLTFLLLIAKFWLYFYQLYTVKLGHKSNPDIRATFLADFVAETRI